MLVNLAVQYVIIGHSERRELFAETDTSVNLKLKSALEYRLTPMVSWESRQKSMKHS